jgi:hypothetical protein
MKQVKPYRTWSAYLKNLLVWVLVTLGVSVATVLAIFKGIYLVMDHFLKDDRFYEGFAASVGISLCGTVVLFGAVFALIRKFGRYPRRKFKGI